MKVTQLHTLINAVTQEVLGETAGIIRPTFLPMISGTSSLLLTSLYGVDGVIPKNSQSSIASKGISSERVS